MIYEVVLAIHSPLNSMKKHGFVLVKSSGNGVYREFQKHKLIFLVFC